MSDIGLFKVTLTLMAEDMAMLRRILEETNLGPCVDPETAKTFQETRARILLAIAQIIPPDTFVWDYIRKCQDAGLSYQEAANDFIGIVEEKRWQR